MKTDNNSSPLAQVSLEKQAKLSNMSGAAEQAICLSFWICAITVILNNP